MHRQTIALYAAIAFLLAAPAFAEQTIEPLGKTNCRVVNLGEPTRGEWVTWTGQCKDGYAHGQGVLEWLADGELKSYYSGDMVRGLEHGRGYYKNRFGIEYSGGYKNGKYDGTGTLLNFDGRYEGKWKDGKRNGVGTMVFTLSGSYRGGWKDDLFHGKGEIAYVGGGKRAGQFVDGRLAGSQGPAQPARIHRIEPTRTSLRLVADTSTSPQPYTGPYADMTPEQKATLRSMYLLDENDEPPYPVNGTKQIYQAVARLAREPAYGAGPFLIHVKVDKDGNATEVVVPASPGDDATQAIAAVLMKEKYKPGVCKGKPCAMDFPFSTTLGAAAQE